MSKAAGLRWKDHTVVPYSELMRLRENDLTLMLLRTAIKRLPVGMEQQLNKELEQVKREQDLPF